jgi:membrane protein DedA with SNARE-associated domain
VWTLTFITFGWYVGPAWETALATAHRHLLVVVIGVAVLVGAYAFIHRAMLRRADGSGHQDHEDHKDHEN